MRSPVQRTPFVLRPWGETEGRVEREARERRFLSVPRVSCKRVKMRRSRAKTVPLLPREDCPDGLLRKEGIRHSPEWELTYAFLLSVGL